MKLNNILIVEDEIIATKYLISILNDFDIYSIYEAKNAKDAIEIVKRQEIDLVFMDINIEGSIDGIQCAELINQEQSLPIIFTTAYTDVETIEEAVNTNIFGYLSKPFDKKDVKISLSMAVKLLKKINSLSEKNSDGKKKEIIHLNSISTYNLHTKTLYINNEVVNFTRKELEIFDIFCININTNLSYEYLKEMVWINKDIGNSTIRDTVSRMKKKIPHLNIETLNNFGYILKV